MNKDTLKEWINTLEKGKFIEKMVAAKALKQISEHTPEVLVPCYPAFLKILADKNVKVAWATLFLLTPMAVLKPELAFENLGLFAQIADGDSVIARDQYVKILTELATHAVYKETCLTLLLDEVLKAPVNQLPAYAKSAVSVIDREHAKPLKGLIISRLPEVEDYPPKTRKLQQLIKQLHQL
ncbi:MAG: hypothetical protein EOP54_09150 [Sphingobacteriales bacterium]|nr:MAG: hypothetical protein EOP54_09150 [Sphingobacteriales bacterium]